MKAKIVFLLSLIHLIVYRTNAEDQYGQENKKRGDSAKLFLEKPKLKEDISIKTHTNEFGHKVKDLHSTFSDSANGSSEDFEDDDESFNDNDEDEGNENPIAESEDEDDIVGTIDHNTEQNKSNNNEKSDNEKNSYEDVHETNESSDNSQNNINSGDEMKTNQVENNNENHIINQSHDQKPKNELESELNNDNNSGVSELELGDLDKLGKGIERNKFRILGSDQLNESTYIDEKANKEAIDKHKLQKSTLETNHELSTLETNNQIDYTQMSESNSHHIHSHDGFNHHENPERLLESESSIGTSMIEINGESFGSTQSKISSLHQLRLLNNDQHNELVYKDEDPSKVSDGDDEPQENSTDTNNQLNKEESYPTVNSNDISDEKTSDNGNQPNPEESEGPISTVEVNNDAGVYTHGFHAHKHQSHFHGGHHHTPHAHVHQMHNHAHHHHGSSKRLLQSEPSNSVGMTEVYETDPDLNKNAFTNENKLSVLNNDQQNESIYNDEDPSKASTNFDETNQTSMDTNNQTSVVNPNPTVTSDGTNGAIADANNQPEETESPISTLELMHKVEKVHGDDIHAQIHPSHSHGELHQLHHKDGYQSHSHVHHHHHYGDSKKSSESEPSIGVGMTEENEVSTDSGESSTTNKNQPSLLNNDQQNESIYNDEDPSKTSTNFGELSQVPISTNNQTNVVGQNTTVTNNDKITGGTTVDNNQPNEEEVESPISTLEVKHEIESVHGDRIHSHIHHSHSHHGHHHFHHGPHGHNHHQHHHQNSKKSVENESNTDAEQNKEGSQSLVDQNISQDKLDVLNDDQQNESVYNDSGHQKSTHISNNPSKGLTNYNEANKLETIKEISGLETYTEIEKNQEINIHNHPPHKILLDGEKNYPISPLRDVDSYHTHIHQHSEPQNSFHDQKDHVLYDHPTSFEANNKLQIGNPVGKINRLLNQQQKYTESHDNIELPYESDNEGSL